MANYQLTEVAKQELKEIYRYTAKQYGEAQADHYTARLLTCFEMLGDYPHIGRECDYILNGYRRHEHNRHIIYYTAEDSEITIVRIVGAGQASKNHL